MRFSTKHFKELIGFGLSIVGHRIVNFLDTKAGAFLIGYFLGATPLGYYTIGYRLYQTITDLFSGVINPITFPLFSRLQTDSKRLLEIFFEGSRLICLLAFPAFLGLIIVSPEIITTFFGPEWKPSTPVIRWLALAGMVQSVLAYNGTLVMALGKPVSLLKIRGFATALISLTSVFAVHWGIAAVAAAYAIVYLVTVAPMHFSLVFRLTQMETKSYFAILLAPLGSSAAMLITVIGLKFVITDNALDIVKLLIYTFAGGLVYLTATYVLSPSVLSSTFQYIKLIRPKKEVESL
jgi:PST family polysaccharide transporter